MDWFNNISWISGWEKRAKAAYSVLEPYFPFDKIIDIGCGTKIVKKIIPCKEYVGYDLIGQPDVLADINECNIENGDLLIGLGILEYIDLEKFLKRDLSKFKVCIFSYVPEEKRDKEDHENGWINRFKKCDIEKRLGKHQHVDGYDFFIMVNKND